MSFHGSIYLSETKLTTINKYILIEEKPAQVPPSNFLARHRNAVWGTLPRAIPVENFSARSTFVLFRELIDERRFGLCKRIDKF